MSTRENGGPAFPFMRDVRHNPDFDYEEGMTLRDYLVAHAPAVPQPWFKPSAPPRPKPVWVGDTGTVYGTRLLAEAAEGEDGYCDINASAAREWEAEYQKQRYVQWPAAWADEQLKLRSES